MDCPCRLFHSFRFFLGFRLIERYNYPGQCRRHDAGVKESGLDKQGDSDAPVTITAKLAGKYVTIKDTVRSFKELVEGKHDGLPLNAFMYVGTLDDARKKAEKMKA